MGSVDGLRRARRPGARCAPATGPPTARRPPGASGTSRPTASAPTCGPAARAARQVLRREQAAWSRASSSWVTSSRASSGHAGGFNGSPPSSVAIRSCIARRARWSRLFSAGTSMPTTFAASSADRPSTSRRSTTSRCDSGRASSASWSTRAISRAWARSSGPDAGALTSRTSAPSRDSWREGSPAPLRRALVQKLRATWYSQVESWASPRTWRMPLKAASSVSWSTSRASSSLPHSEPETEDSSLVSGEEGLQSRVVPGPRRLQQFLVGARHHRGSVITPGRGVSHE